tara:strand:- start:782 stop:2083 length:1302 start_codon:yes stop_codon:yes gene_type:complete
MKNELILNNARIIDPESGFDAFGYIYIKDGKINNFEKKINKSFSKNIKVIDCNKKILCPGIIDMSVSTGEPGSEHKETIFTASKAAASGGITTIITLPDTKPCIDDVALVEFIIRRAKNEGIVNVLPMASLTKNLAGEQMAEIGLLKEAGAVAFTDGYNSIANAKIMRLALAYASNFDALIVHHTEVPELIKNTDMNEGEVSTILGLEGAPSVAESIMIERDIGLLNSISHGRYHISSISTAESVETVRNAKKNINTNKISAAVAPYHFTLNEKEIFEYRTFAKLSPPLRTETDRQAIIKGIKDDTIEIIASHHRPEPQEKKRLPFAQAAFGSVGLETLLATSLNLYHNKEMELIDVLHKLTAGPANLLRLNSGKIKIGYPADLILFDPETPWKVNSDNFLSKSKNSTYDEKPLQGKVLITLVAGKIVFPFES